MDSGVNVGNVHTYQLIACIAEEALGCLIGRGKMPLHIQGVDKIAGVFNRSQ